MSVANLEAYALSQGIDKSWASMTQAEQTTLRYQYLMKTTADAQGDFGRTLETSFPNQLRVAQMQIETMATSVGQTFLPMFLDMFKSINLGFKSGDWGVVGENIGQSIGQILTKVLNMIPALLQVIVPIFQGALYSLVAAIPTILPALTTAILQMVIAILDTLMLSGPQLITAGLDAITNLIVGLSNSMPLIVDTALTLILALLDGLIKNIPILIPAATAAIQNFVMGLLDKLPEIIQTAITLIITLVNALIAALPILIKMLPMIVETIVKVIVDNLPMLIDAAIQLILAITMALIDNLDILIPAAIEIILAVAAGLISAVPQLIKAVPKLIKAISDALIEFDWPQLGRNIIDGIAEGVKSVAGNLGDSVAQAASEALQAAKDFLGIQSPSTVMRDQVGKMIGAGLAVGIDDSAGKVNAAMKELNSGLVAEAQLNVNATSAPMIASAAPQEAVARL